MCPGSYLPISAALPQGTPNPGCDWTQSPIYHPMETEFCKDITLLSLMKAIVLGKTYSDLFYPGSFTMRGQNGTVKRAWDLETCSPEAESLPHCLLAQNNDSYYLLRIYSIPGTCFISFHLHNYPMKQVLTFSPIYKEETEAQDR